MTKGEPVTRRIKLTPASEIEFEPYRNQWGPWKLDPEEYALYVEPGDYLGQKYDIDLESCVSSAEVCDWIVQVSRKTWADAETVAGLVCALDDLLYPQANLCPWGQSRRLSKAKIRAMVDQYTRTSITLIVTQPTPAQTKETP